MFNIVAYTYRITNNPSKTFVATAVVATYTVNEIFIDLTGSATASENTGNTLIEHNTYEYELKIDGVPTPQDVSSFPGHFILSVGK